MLYRGHLRDFLHVISICYNHKINIQHVRLEVPMAVTMKITVSWDVTLCSLMVANVSDEYTASIFRAE
jgi:hypothetical protein